nr:MAG TPA: hypothetical protein [Caudoviricetes sp.]
MFYITFNSSHISILIIKKYLSILIIKKYYCNSIYAWNFDYLTSHNIYNLIIRKLV